MPDSCGAQYRATSRNTTTSASRTGPKVAGVNRRSCAADPRAARPGMSSGPARMAAGTSARAWRGAGAGRRGRAVSRLVRPAWRALPGDQPPPAAQAPFRQAAPSTPSRARLTAAASRAKSAATLTSPRTRGRRLAFDAVIDAGVVQPSDELTGAVSGIAVDRRLAIARGGGRGLPAVLGLGAVLITGEHVTEQALSDLGIPAVSRRGLGGGDDLRVRVDRDVPLVAVEPPRGGLMPVPGLRVEGGDDPARGDPAGDPEHPGRVLLQILAGHASQQRRSLRQRLAQLLPVQGRHPRPGLAGQRIDQFPPGRRV